MQNTLPICGFQKTTLLDFPGHVASTVFLGGCNFRCPFCHNGELVLFPNDYTAYSTEDILSHLQKRKGILSGVCISGGEPTLYPELIDFMDKIKELGYLIKLDTNGSHPELLKTIISKGLVDYIAMDIKSSPDSYHKACGLICSNPDTDNLLSVINTSIAVIRNSSIPYEFRTTVVKGLHSADTFAQIGLWLNGKDHYFLQNYVESEHVLQPGFSGFTKDELLNFAEICKPYFASVTLRGID